MHVETNTADVIPQPPSLASASPPTTVPGRTPATTRTSVRSTAATAPTRDDDNHGVADKHTVEDHDEELPDAELLAALALPSAYELSAQEKAMLPDLSFSVHAYSVQPTGRMVRINGRAHREGGTVSKDLQIAEITKHGVIFDLKGARFFMSSSDSWRTQSENRR
ncbi:MAG: general secretion pathway protein GspB [Hyphomicrobiales bacterium]|nr:general secretion pathway protein GspB [Hyphomicrobiales bacterium]